MAATEPTPVAAASGRPARGTVHLDRVSHGYGDARRWKPVVEDCTLDVPAGGLTVVIGPSGCGKSTIARLVAGYEAPVAGTVRLDGAPVRGPGRERLMVFQESALFGWMDTRTNALFGPDQSREPRSRSVPRVGAMLDAVGLGRFARRLPGELSGGMQRRLEVVRALVNQPLVMILDEPFRGLDAMTRALMQESFAAEHADGTRTTLFITTDIDEAILLADRIVVMTNAPARVAGTFAVDLPRPRTLAGLNRDDRANAIKVEVLTIPHREALRAFASGSKAAGDLVEAYARARVR